MNAGNSSVGSTPSRRTSAVVHAVTVRTPSARRPARPATASGSAAKRTERAASHARYAADELAHVRGVSLRGLQPLRRACERTFGEPSLQDAVAEEMHERICKRRCVAWRNKEAVDAVLDDVRNAPGACAHDRPATAKRLDDDARQSLGAGRQHEGGRIVERSGDLRLRKARLPRGLLGKLREERLD